MPQNVFPWTGAEAPTWDEIRDKPATFPPPTATATVVGGVLEGAHIAQLTAAPTETDFNNLLTVLQTAGILASS